MDESCIIFAGGYSLIGVTSWGDGCAVDGTFGVYARVEFYMQWVAAQFGHSGGTRIYPWILFAKCYFTGVG